MSDAGTWDERYSTADLVWSEGPNQLVADLVTPLAAGRAVDLASGEGRNAIWLATRGWQVTAVDFSSVGIEKARRRAAEQEVDITWIVADLTSDHVLPERAFDLALIAYLHLPTSQLHHVLGAAARSLVQGGRLLIVGHDRSNLEKGVGRPQDPTLLYTAGNIASALAELDVNLELERSEVVERIIKPSGSASDAQDHDDDQHRGIALDTLVWGRRL